MSFWELWDCHSKVQDNWYESKELLFSFLQVLNNKIDIETAYSSGLQRISNMALFHNGKNTLLPSLEKLYSCMTQKSRSLNELIEQQRNDIIPAIKFLIQEQDEDIRTKARYASDFSNKLEQHKKSVLKAKETYYTTLDDPKSSKKSEDSITKKYLKCVDEGNQFLALYEENMKQIFLIYQYHEEKRMQIFKDSLKKFTVYEVAFMRSVQYELDLLPIAVDALSPDIEIKKFIDDSASGKTLTNFIFEVHPKQANSTQTNKVFGLKQVDALDKIFEKCWKSELINDSDNKQFNEIITVAEGRKMWVAKLNEKMLQEAFLIPSCTFGIICGLTITLLDRVLEYNDISCAKQIIFLTQYFYEETLSQRTYMHQMILTHELWDDYKLWGNFIITSVDLEIESDAKICAEDLNSINQALKIRPVVTCKITSYIQQMKNFMLDEITIEKVLKLIQEYYNFGTDLIKSEN